MMNDNVYDWEEQGDFRSTNPIVTAMTLITSMTLTGIGMAMVAAGGSFMMTGTGVLALVLAILAFSMLAALCIRKKEGEK